MTKEHEAYFDDGPDAPYEAERLLRGHSTATLKFGDLTESLKYVLDEDGEPVAPVAPAILDAFDTVLFIPDQVRTVIELIITAESVDPETAVVDRWKIYHGQPHHREFARLYVEAAKWGEHVVDGDSFTQPNALAKVEGPICKHMNTDHRDALRLMCAHFADVEVEEPLMVGIDPFGFDVRAKFGIIRVEFEEQIESADEARTILVEMTNQARESAARPDDGSDG